MATGLLAYLTAALSGALMPVQTGVNTRLRAWAGSPVVASFLSFAVSLALLVALMVALGAVPDPALFEGLPWWMYLGGVCGFIVLTGNILMLPRLGAVQVVVLPAAGQIAMGLVIDAFGMFGLAQRGLTPVRAAGALLVVAGVLLVSLGRAAGKGLGTSGGGGAGLMAWRAFAVAAGALSAAQTAVNGRLGLVLGSAVPASVVSFAVGASLLGVIAAATVGLRRVRGGSLQHAKGVWWMWLGGPMGAAMVLLNAALAPVIGTGSVVVLFLAGSVVAGVLVDQLGLFGAGKRLLDARRALGLALLVAGAALVRLS